MLLVCLTFNRCGSPAEVRGDHAVHIDPIAQLQGDGHSEPACAQPRIGYPPADRDRTPQRENGSFLIRFSECD